ncbi:MAG TPA: hypothetical protein VMU76_07960 [Acidimicrobiales bacterium]|nr:hypothetical protein [Acidimicrobiales bacterium]
MFPVHTGVRHEQGRRRFGDIVAELAWVDTLLDPLLARGYLAGLSERPLEQIQVMRNDCRETEAIVSFIRRVVQGRLDIVQAILEARSAGRETTSEEMVGRLAAIMARPSPPNGLGRLEGPFAPDTESKELSSVVATILDVADPTDLVVADESDLQRTSIRFSELEHVISAQRRALHAIMRGLREAVCERYAAV